MSMNGSGVYVVNSAGQPVVATTLITAAAFNAFTADIATAMSTAVMKDGQTVITANIPLAGFKLTGVGPATARTDAATLANVQDSTGVYVATVGGTADVITLTPSPAITAYAAGQTFRFIASGANTTNVTVAISGLTAKAITKDGTTALATGDIPSGAMVQITYDGTRFIIGTPGKVIPLNVIDAGGDLIYGTADNTVGRVAIGTARQMLQVNTGATAPVWANPITLATQQATTSGTSIDFTSIPAGVRRITVMFVGVSTNGTDSILIQIGDAGGIEATGYLAAVGIFVVGAASVSAATTGFCVATMGATGAASVIHGSVTLSLENAATFTWVCAGIMNQSDLARSFISSGSKSTSAELDRVRITTVTGVDTFDAGAINISYE